MNLTQYLRISFILSLFLTSLISVAQVPLKSLKFDKELIDFDTIAFDSDPILLEYIFTNTSDVNFEIKNVMASCGCTNTEWTKVPVKPGEKGYVKATFNPKGIAGDVEKSLDIYGNFSNATTKILTFKGHITEPEELKTQEYFKGQYGYLLTNKNILGLGRVFDSRIYTEKVFFYNDYNIPVHIKSLLKAPEYVNVEFSKKELQPGDTSWATITMDMSQVGKYGLINDDITIETTDAVIPIKGIKVAFDLQKDFSKLKKRQLKKAPVIMANQQHFDLGTIKSGTIKQFSVEIKNNGLDTLRIYNVETVCGCTTIGFSSAKIAPGESLRATLKFDSLFMKGQSNKQVVLYTNDPKNHRFTFLVSANIIEN
ncbi:MAG: DUF1573 domain-containing protein [Flavobacteriales bacterium]|nr:DUF1573 domain-containing protein [Flavobacteriales bacterium]